MYLELLAFALVGKLLIYLAQQFPFQKVAIIGKLFEQDKFFGKLLGCDLCAGVWIYSLLNFLFQINLLEQIFYVWIVSEVVSGMILSFIVHLISVGWNTKYQEIVIE